METLKKFADIEISGKTYPIKEILKKAGFTYNNKKWNAKIEESRLKKLKNFVRENNLKCKITGNQVKHETIYPAGKSDFSINFSSPVIYGEGRMNNDIFDMMSIEYKRNSKRKYK
jgi:beta-lactamase superfamily II metal-dependent hydrolase